MGPVSQPGDADGRKVFTFELIRYPGYHVVNNSYLLNSFTNATGQVSVGGSGRRPYEGFGTLEIFLKYGNDDWNFVKLDHVYFVPDVKMNILSMRRLEDVDGLKTAKEGETYRISRGTDLIAETFHSKKDDHTYVNTVGAFNMANPRFILNRPLSTSEIASFLNKSLEEINEYLGIE